MSLHILNLKAKHTTTLYSDFDVLYSRNSPSPFLKDVSSLWFNF